MKYGRDELSVGDVVWAKRYKTLKEAKSVLESHRNGPFIVIKKTKCRVYALSCTSNEYNKMFKYKYNIGNINELSIKSTIVCLDKVFIINKNNYIKTIGAITSDTLNNIKKLLYLITINNKVKNLNKKDIKFIYKIGDLIKYKDKLYYIYGNYNSNFKCILVSKNNKGNILINNKKYEIIKNNIILNKYSHYKLVDMSLQNEVANIIHNMFYNKIIKFNNKYYYVYSKDSLVLNCYELYENEVDKSIFLGKIFMNMYTKFKKVNLYEINNIEIIYSIKKIGINKIKNILNNNISNKRKDNNLKMLKNCTNPVGKIINNNDGNYLIIKKEGNFIKLFSLSDYKTMQYYSLNSRYVKNCRVHDIDDDYYKELINKYELVTSNK